MYGINEINIENINIGNYAYNNYTKQWYIISILPNIIKNDCHIYALIRLDGSGYYCKSESLEELKKNISLDGGETIIYKNLVMEG